MAYNIIIQNPAKEDAREYAAFILKESKNPRKANRWLQELVNIIEGLSEMPKRYKIIDEQDAFDIPLNQALHHSHRVIFHVNDDTQTVHILRIYHGARLALTPEEIPDF